MNNLAVKLFITVGAIVFVIVHLVWPNLLIDAITLGLIVIAILPWLSSLIESAEFPGGWKIKFRDIEAAGEKVASESSIEAPTPTIEPAFLSIAELDPNLSLVGLRIEIEKRLRSLAKKRSLPKQRSLNALLDQLSRHHVLKEVSITGLRELIEAGNQAAHGAKVEESVALWALEHGPKILATLDAELAREAESYD